MENNTVIKAEHVSKKYCKSLRRSMSYGIKDIGKNMFGVSSHSDKLREEEFWAVNDVSFELRRGETLGIIGPNGSGKTTLLKLLNGIFWPDKGKIAIKGKVGALIEVGTGFHPLLTGRENIYINGAILGMNKKELDEKFNEIVEFAGIGDFIDVPVKFYSSGMYVRLGFAIAVHCDPDILLIDEVLSVGDTSFRNKCYQKMNEIKKKNVAIIFISHDLFSVGKFCDRGIFIDKGVVKKQGEIKTVIKIYQDMIKYLSTEFKNAGNVVPGLPYCTKEVKIISVKFLNQDGKEQNEFAFGDTLRIRIKYKTAKNKVHFPQFQIAIHQYDKELVCVFGTHLNNIQIQNIEEEGVIECYIENIPLLSNKYYINVNVFNKTRTVFFDRWGGDIRDDLSFHILSNNINAMMNEYAGICHFDSKWFMNEKELKASSNTE